MFKNNKEDDFKYLTSDKIIRNALKLVDKKVIDNLYSLGAKISFKDFNLLGLSNNYFATNCINNIGDRAIYINEKYKNSCIESLACLITHESYHKLEKPTFDEEVDCTIKEVFLWLNIRPKNYIKNDLTDRLDKHYNNIVSFIKLDIFNNNAYKDLTK